MKKTSLYWAPVVGLLAIAAQIVWFLFRSGLWSFDASITDYIVLFLAGTFGGVILVYFLNRQASIVQRRVVLIAFLLASPVAVFLMLLGGWYGSLGILISPQIPWVISTWTGSLVAELVSGR